jgi:hypothetical protein
MKTKINLFIGLIYKMANFLKNVEKAVTHGGRAGKKGKRAIRQAKKAKKAAKKGDVTGAEKFAAKAYKSGKQATKQGIKGGKAVKRGGKQLIKAGTAAAARNPAGVASAFVE